MLPNPTPSRLHVVQYGVLCVVGLDLLLLVLGLAHAPALRAPNLRLFVVLPFFLLVLYASSVIWQRLWFPSKERVALWIGSWIGIWGLLINLIAQPHLEKLLRDSAGYQLMKIDRWRALGIIPMFSLPEPSLAILTTGGDAHV